MVEAIIAGRGEAFDHTHDLRRLMVMVAGDLEQVPFDADGIDMETLADREILRRIAIEKRSVVTNDVLDFQLIHNQL